MKIEVTVGDAVLPGPTPRIGNVYAIKGGRGLRYGHMMILLAITEPLEYRGQTALLLVVDKNGGPVGVTSYGLNYITEQTPIAFCDGVEETQWTIRSL